MRNAILLCIGLGALAQQPVSGQKLFDLGVKAGISMDDLSTGYAHHALAGGNVGLFARVKPPVLPGVQGEVLLSSMGSTVTVEDQTSNIRTMTLQLPLFVVFSLGPVELHAGGYYDRQLARSWNISGMLTVGDDEVSLDDLREGSFGALVGAGLRFSHFYLGARYNYGLQDLASGPYLNDIRNRQGQFYLGWGFF
jgi:hypothetical protein